MSAFLIREVNGRDAVSVSEIFRAAYGALAEAQKLSVRTREHMYEENTPGKILKRFAGNYFYIAEDKESHKIVGVIGLRKHGNASIHNRISTFFVLPEYQSSGVGSLLFHTLLSVAEKIGVTTLVVRSSLYAEKIYAHWKFKRTRLLKQKYSNGDVYTTVWMEKVLSPKPSGKRDV